MSYKEEREAIWKWYEQKLNEYCEAPVERGHLDSDANVKHRENTAEYNRRLDALDEKYGKKVEAEL